MSAAAVRRLLLGGGALLVLGLSAWIDRPLSALFYRPGEGFFLDRTWPAQLIYHGTRWMTGALIVAVLAALIWAAVTRRRRVRQLALFVALAYAIGPGLIVNGVLKEHWGRPRPEQVVEFGGSAAFVPALLPTGSCGHNCSFVSGHAAAGFFLITGAWIWPQRRAAWLTVGLAAGGLIGLTRMVQGGHFFTDVFGALLVVCLTDELLYWLMLRLNWLEAPAKAA